MPDRVRNKLYEAYLSKIREYWRDGFTDGIHEIAYHEDMMSQDTCSGFYVYDERSEYHLIKYMDNEDFISFVSSLRPENQILLFDRLCCEKYR